MLLDQMLDLLTAHRKLYTKIMHSYDINVTCDKYICQIDKDKKLKSINVNKRAHILRNIKKTNSIFGLKENNQTK